MSGVSQCTLRSYSRSCSTLAGVVLGLLLVGCAEDWDQAKVKRETWEIRSDGTSYVVVDNHGSAHLIWSRHRTYEAADAEIAAMIRDFHKSDPRKWPIVTNTYGR